MPSAEKLQASNSSQLEAIRGGLLTYDDSVDVKKVTKSSNIKFVVIDIEIEIVIAIDLSNSNRYCHL